MRSLNQFLRFVFKGILCFAAGYAAANPEIDGVRLSVYDLPKKAPTVLVMHGCDGATQPYRDWAKMLNDWGFNAVVVDSFSKRSVKSICSFEESKRLNDKVSPYIRTLDQFKVAKWVSNQSWHSGKIGAIGFSHGGCTALMIAKFSPGNLLEEGGVEEADLRLISAVVAYYPGCQLTSPPYEPTMPLMMHLAMKDDWTPPEHCSPHMLYHKNFTVLKYPDAGHAFDMDLPRRVVAGYTVYYDREADLKSRAATKEFFEKYIKH